MKALIIIVSIIIYLVIGLLLTRMEYRKGILSDMISSVDDSGWVLVCVVFWPVVLLVIALDAVSVIFYNWFSR